MLSMRKTVVIIVGCLLVAEFASSVENSAGTNSGAEAGVIRVDNEASLDEEPISVEQRQAYPTATAGSPDSAEWLIKFTKNNLFELSRTIRVSNNLQWPDKCEEYEKILRHIVQDERLKKLTTLEVFLKAISSLEKRTNKFGSSNIPYVQPLRDCVTSLLSYKPPESPRAAVDPNAGKAREGLISLDANDVYHLSKFIFELRPLDSITQKCRKYEEKLREILKGRVEESLGAPELFSRVISSLEQRPFVLRAQDDHPFVDNLKTCLEEGFVHRQSPEAGWQAEVNFEHASDHDAQDSGDELDPVEKLKRELEHERELGKSLMAQLDQHRRQIDELLEEKNKHQKSGDGGPDDRARFEMMRDMSEQASEREAVANGNLAELQRGHTDESRQQDGDDRVEVYEDKAIAARELEAQMKSNDPLESCCMKYYMLYKYPEALDESVVATLARLPVPASEIKDVAAFRQTLKELLDIVNQKGEEFEPVSARLSKCLQLASLKTAPRVFASTGSHPTGTSSHPTDTSSQPTSTSSRPTSTNSPSTGVSVSASVSGQPMLQSLLQSHLDRHFHTHNLALARQGHHVTSTSKHGVAHALAQAQAHALAHAHTSTLPGAVSVFSAGHQSRVPLIYSNIFGLRPHAVGVPV